MPHLRDDRVLDLRRRHAAHRALRVALADGVGGDVVAVELAVLPRVRRRHRVAARREDQALQQRRRLRSAAVAAGDGVLGHDGVHLVPGGAVDDRLVLAGIARALVHRLAEVDAVVQDLVERALVDRLARPVLAVLRRPRLRRVAGAAQLLRQLRRRAEAQEPLEDQPDQFGLFLVDHQLAVDDVVAERRNAAHPHALAARRGELVADPLADHLALELGEAEQDVERQPAHRRRGVERLRDRDERDVVPLEDLDDAGEVGERAADSRSTL